MKSQSKSIVILGSGGGSNAAAIISAFEKSKSIKVVSVISNVASAGILQKAQAKNIPAIHFSREAFSNGTALEYLQKSNLDLIILAGFLLKIPEEIVRAFPHKIINIHPALLPNYGGKGMYGENVHKAVLENNEEKSGITIHYVDEEFDSGKIILQKEVDISECTDYSQVAKKVLALEHDYFAPTIAKILRDEI